MGDSTSNTSGYEGAGSMAQPTIPQDQSSNTQPIETPVANENFAGAPEPQHTSAQVPTQVGAPQAQPIQMQTQSPQTTSTETQ